MKKDPKKALPYRVMRLRARLDEPYPIEATARTKAAAEKRAREIKRSHPDDPVEVQRRSDVRSSFGGWHWTTVVRLCLALVVLSLSACGPDLAPEPPDVVR